jgi:hypothetical protein
MDSCGFKVMYDGEEISGDCVKPFPSNFHYPNKKYDRGGKTFQPALVFAEHNLDFKNAFDLSKHTVGRYKIH